MSAIRQPTEGQGSCTNTAVSGSHSNSPARIFPGQGQPLGSSLTPMEVDGPSGSQQSIDWQFYFDTLAPRLSAELDDLSTFLGIFSDKLDSIRKEYQTQHEQCFHMLWKWYKDNSISGKNDDEKLKKLRQALKAAGLNILVQEEIPSRENYQFCGNVIEGTTNFKEGGEILRVAKKTSTVAARLGRYFRLNEDDITRVVSNNNNDTVKQARGIIEACVKECLLKTRQDLCDGLNYIEETNTIEEMNRFWSG